MEEFTIHQLARELEQAMATSTEAQAEVEKRLRSTIEQFGAQTIVDALQAAIPEGASIGEMIVYRSPALTMLYGRIPPHFRSAIHDHTVFASIAQLTGVETSVVYEKNDDGDSLRVAREMVGRPGDITSLPADAIHHIENPTDDYSSALHVYGGDFDAVADDRSLWSHDGSKRDSFSFEKLLKQSVVAMKRTGNDEGLAGLVQAIPATQAMVDAL
jgi:predicted metal-dependent enzyme (double-stranded beta helix superfamily)